jgi:hypothetical protein
VDRNVLCRDAYHAEYRVFSSVKGFDPFIIIYL